MATTTSSPLRAPRAPGPAVAPVSAARSASVSGPRELATKTSCPSARRRRVRVPPIWPAPMMPILMSASQGSWFDEASLAVSLEDAHGPLGGMSALLPSSPRRCTLTRGETNAIVAGNDMVAGADGAAEAALDTLLLDEALILAEAEGCAAVVGYSRVAGRGPRAPGARL